MLWILWTENGNIWETVWEMWKNDEKEEKNLGISYFFIDIGFVFMYNTKCLSVRMDVKLSTAGLNLDSPAVE